MELEQLTPRVYHLRFSQKEDRPSLGYIRGDRFSLMVDAGNSPQQVALFRAAVQAAGFRQPDLVALTHSHWDHCFGLCSLDIPSIACVQTRQSLEMFSRLQWTPDALEENAQKGIIPQACVSRIRLHYPQLEKIRVVLPTMVYSEEMTLDLGNCTCVLKRVTSPHARDTAIVWVKEEQMVFLGDAVYQELVGDTWVERPRKLRLLMEQLERLDFQLCQPAHQRALTKSDLIAWFQRRLRKSEEG